MNQPTIEQAKNSYRDSASILLYLFRNDTTAIREILRANDDDPTNLLSGMIAVAGMITQRVFGEEALPMIESLVDYLAQVPDSDWELICQNAKSL